MQLTGKAILFDFDGVLIDSDPVYERHWQQWAEAHGASYEHIISIHHGIPAVRTISIVAPHLDPVYEANQFLVKAVVDLDGLIAPAGVASILPQLPADRWAIATSSYRRMVGEQLSYLGLPEPRVLVTIDDVTEGKPAPEPYLQAAEKLGFVASDCIVIEDSPAGITAGKKAGAQVIAIASTKTIDALQEADMIVERFIDLDFQVSGDDILIGQR
ncbi:MAG: HAD-IA family hydrolase [Rhodothermales bacterium]